MKKLSTLVLLLVLSISLHANTRKLTGVSDTMITPHREYRIETTITIDKHEGTFEIRNDMFTVKEKYIYRVVGDEDMVFITYEGSVLFVSNCDNSQITYTEGDYKIIFKKVLLVQDK